MKKAGITMAKMVLETKCKETLPNVRMSILYNLAGTEGIITFYNIPSSWFMGKIFSSDIIKIYESKDRSDVDKLISSAAFTDKTKVTMK